MNAQSQTNNKPNGLISGTTNNGNMSFLTLLAAASSLDLAAKSSSNRAQVNDDKQNATYPSSTFLSLKKKTKLSAGTISNGHSSSDANLSVTQRIVSSVAPKQQRQQQKSKKAKPPKPTFPEELMRMVSDESNASIITFLPCGKRFIILDKDAFVNDVLPKSALAMQTPSGGRVKISSFTRRLNRWGFLQCRVPGLENELVFAHPKFVRDEPKICKDIKSGSVPPAAKQNIFKSLSSKAILDYRNLPATARNEMEESEAAKTPPTMPIYMYSTAQGAPALPTIICNRPVIGINNIAMQTSPSALPQSKNASNQQMMLQAKYADVLRMQAQLQERAVISNSLLHGMTAAGSACNVFLPHSAVMAATRTVAAGAMNVIHRDRTLFAANPLQQAGVALQQPRQAEQASKLETQEIRKRSLLVALDRYIEFSNRAA